MLEKALKGGPSYWGLLGLFGLLAAAGTGAYLFQLHLGLGITGMTRDVSWGLYIAQFTFMVGVAASAVMVVLPYYLHDYKAFAKLVVLGECLAIAAVIMCQLFIFVDMGRPDRVLNVLLHPHPSSMIFWDMVVLSGYLLVNLVIAGVTFSAEREGTAPPAWIRPVILLSIPLAISIHTVTAFLYAGLPGRAAWLNPALAPRFLASAFASGPALLLLLCLVVRKYTRFDAGKEALGKLAQIVTYALAVYLFLTACELFTALYSGIEEHAEHLKHLFLTGPLAPFAWISLILATVAFVALLCPKVRQCDSTLGTFCLVVVLAIWLEKGVVMVISGFQPSPLGHAAPYSPTAPEILVTLGIYGLGGLILTALYKVVTAVREHLNQEPGDPPVTADDPTP